MQWERVKKAGMAPGARTSFAMVTHKRRAVLFGGILDREGQVGGWWLLAYRQCQGCGPTR